MSTKKMSSAGTSCTNDTHRWVAGIVTVLLGLAVWPTVGWLTLSQLFAIVFVLVGLKKLFWNKCCH
jgi:hypothetical protein